MEDLNISQGDNLYNKDLRPKTEREKNVKPFGYALIWFGMAVQVSAFLSLSPMINYFTVSQFILVLTMGSIIIGFLAFIAQDIGIRYGISFATSVSATYGYLGGKIINIVRIFPSLFFFGLAAYIGAVALNEIFKVLFDFESIILSLFINIAATVAITVRKLEIIEKVLFFIAPILVIVGIYMLNIVLTAYDVTFFESLSMGRLQGESAPLSKWLFGFAAAAGGFTSVALGMNDFTNDCKNVTKSNKWLKSNYKYSIATLLGLVPAYTFVALVGAITIALSGRTNVIVVISELAQEKSIFMAVILQLFIILAQMATNAPANLMPSAYAISALAPRQISYKAALFGFAALSFLVIPLAMGENVALILTIFSSTAGPAIAIIAIDYYVFKKRYLDINELYNSDGKYRYSKGINAPAMIVFVAATGVGFIFSDISFYASTILAAGLYLLMGRVVEKRYAPKVHEKEYLSKPIL